MKDISTIGIDIAKKRFRVVGMTKAGRVVLRKWLDRGEVINFMANLQPCLVGMEACAGAHYWAREIQKFGHVVKLMPPQYVKPYVKTNKNDDNDAEACAEAVTRPTMRFVTVKNEKQQSLMQLHRVRMRVVRARTSLGNEIRGFLGEFGIISPKNIDKLRRQVYEALIKYEERLSGETQEMINRLCEELRRIEDELEFYEEKLKCAHTASPESQRLTTIPGIGKVTATALVGSTSIGQFRNGRHFAAFLGLVPRQHSTGGVSRLGGISKRGDAYLRQLLILGAHAVLRASKGKSDRYNLWVQALYERRGWCKTAVAIANKNARIAWKVLAEGKRFDAQFVPER